MSQPPYYGPSERNKHPILEQMKGILPADALVLEIGSGRAQHAMHFCRAMPGLRWQPSEKGDSMPGLLEQLESAGMDSIAEPLELDVLKDPWPQTKYGAAYTANTAHIMPWQAVTAMFRGAGSVLEAGGLFCIYGPFNVGGGFTSDGNREFDADLRSRNPDMGIRDIEELETLAGRHHMVLQQRISMPANNFLLVFEKTDTTK